MTVTRKKQKQLIGKHGTQKNQIRHQYIVLKPEINHKKNTTNTRRDFFKSLIGLHVVKK